MGSSGSVSYRINQANLLYSRLNIFFRRSNKSLLQNVRYGMCLHRNEKIFFWMVKRDFVYQLSWPDPFTDLVESSSYGFSKKVRIPNADPDTLFCPYMVDRKLLTFKQENGQYRSHVVVHFVVIFPLYISIFRLSPLFSSKPRVDEVFLIDRFRVQ
jgi:hypothetical protein